jgi:hypothetical protein
MATINLTRDEAGHLVGCTESDKKSYARFKKKIESLEVGEMYQIKTWFPRNARFHRLHMAMIARLFDNQEQFADVDALRQWLYVGAGFCDFYPGPKGRMVAIAKSVAWDKLDDAEFEEAHGKVLAFARSEHASAFLWAHLSVSEQGEMIETVLGDFQ